MKPEARRIAKMCDRYRYGIITNKWGKQKIYLRNKEKKKTGAFKDLCILYYFVLFRFGIFNYYLDIRSLWNECA